jgi:hypothetical protein
MYFLLYLKKKSISSSARIKGRRARDYVKDTSLGSIKRIPFGEITLKENPPPAAKHVAVRIPGVPKVHVGNGAPGSNTTV